MRLKYAKIFLDRTIYFDNLFFRVLTISSSAPKNYFLKTKTCKTYFYTIFHQEFYIFFSTKKIKKKVTKNNNHVKIEHVLLDIEWKYLGLGSKTNRLN